MKKHKKFLVFGIMLICLISCISIILVIQKQKEKEMCSAFEFDDVLLQINSVTNNGFLSSDSEMSLYIPLVFSDKADYLFAYNQQYNEYFVLAKNLNEQEILELEDFVNTNNKLFPENQIKLGHENKFVYIVYSKTYISSIEGIIRSYIYC